MECWQPVVRQEVGERGDRGEERRRRGSRGGQGEEGGGGNSRARGWKVEGSGARLLASAAVSGKDTSTGVVRVDFSSHTFVSVAEREGGGRAAGATVVQVLDMVKLVYPLH